MAGKACIIYGCMGTKDIREVEKTGNFYCRKHYPKTAQGHAQKPSAVQKETAEASKTLKKKAS